VIRGPRVADWIRPWIGTLLVFVDFTKDPAANG